MSETTVGLFLCLIAGAASGSFALPMKFTRGWEWENVWFVWTVVALLIVPLTVTLITIPVIGDIYADVGFDLVLTMAAFGVGWGVAQVLFGLAVDAIGMALAFSIVAGMSAALGSVIPLLGVRPGEIHAAGGLSFAFGLALLITGITVCGVAGLRREAAQSVLERAPQRRMRRGLALAVASGVGSAGANFGLAFGGPLLVGARRHGVDPLWAANSIWLPVMLAGSLPNLVYCAYRMHINRTGICFIECRTPMNWLYGAAMGLFWFGSMCLYGFASGKFNGWGTIFGWPVFMSLIVITAGALGIATGEWKSSGARPLQIQILGIGVLVMALFVLSASTRLI